MCESCSPGGTAGDDVRDEALPFERRAQRPRRSSAPHRDAGQDLVPEQAQQVEATNGFRSGLDGCAASRPTRRHTPSAAAAAAAAVSGCSSWRQKMRSDIITVDQRAAAAVLPPSARVSVIRRLRAVASVRRARRNGYDVIGEHAQWRCRNPHRQLMSSAIHPSIVQSFLTSLRSTVRCR